MTHTLHPEIEEAIEKMIKDMELPAEVWAKLFIIQSLGKYLHMPQPIENEPLPEKNDCYRCWIPCSDIYCGKCWQSQEIVMEGPKQSTPQIELPAYVLNNLDYLWLLLDKMIEKSKSHLDKLKSLDK